MTPKCFAYSLSWFMALSLVASQTAKGNGLLLCLIQTDWWIDKIKGSPPILSGYLVYFGRLKIQSVVKSLLLLCIQSHGSFAALRSGRLCSWKADRLLPGMRNSQALVTWAGLMRGNDVFFRGTRMLLLRPVLALLCRGCWTTAFHPGRGRLPFGSICLPLLHK